MKLNKEEEIFPDFPELNDDNSFFDADEFKNLNEHMEDENKKTEVEKIAKILLDQAKIAEGEPIKDSSFYVSTVSDYILKGFNL